MSREASSDMQVEIESMDQLLHVFSDGSKGDRILGLGLETEKLLVKEDTGEAVPFEGSQGIEALLRRIAAAGGWHEVMDQGRVVALTRGGEAVTLEPGGQFELSGAIHSSIAGVAKELHTHIRDLKAASADLQVRFLGLGMQPVTKRENMPWMPKSRYQIMKSYYTERPGTGLDMMLRTAATQLNLDYRSEEDARHKVQVGTAYAPIVSAMYANSSMDEGKRNGFCTKRVDVWLNTDADRCGAPAFFLKGEFSFEKYLNYALDIPMYFVYRQGVYHKHTHQTFRQFLENPAEHKPVMADWINHLTTLFPDVRVKDHLEYRTADATPSVFSIALVALWVGLVYNEDNLALLVDQSAKYDQTQQREAMIQASKMGLAGFSYGKPNKEWAKWLIDTAYRGLQADEYKYLDPLAKLVHSGESLGERSSKRCGTHSWEALKDCPEIQLEWQGL